MKKALKNIGCFFGWLNVLPINILSWLFFFLPQYIEGTFEEIQLRQNGIITWNVNNNSKFYKKLIKDNWWGFVIGSNIVFVDYKPQTDDEQYLKHEEMHVFQNYIFGILFYPIYIIMSCYLWLFRHERHAYLDNPFEKQARKYAKQRIKIPRKEWSNVSNDRWPWW